MNRIQNIGIKTCKFIYNQVRLVLAACASTKMELNYIKQAQCS